jgi:hypothetical protein
MNDKPCHTVTAVILLRYQPTSAVAILSFALWVLEQHKQSASFV